MSSFILKIIGIISMLCDHLSLALIGHFSLYNYLGRLAFPIFAFQTSQSYIHTKDLKKYIFRLFLFASISQIPFTLFLITINSNSFGLNVFFTLLLGVIAILSYDKSENKYLGLLYVILLCVIGEFSKVDYGAFGVACIFLFYFFYKLYSKKDIKINKKLLYQLIMCICFILLLLVNYIPNFIKYPDLFDTYTKIIASTSMSLIFILLYDGKQGPKLKYLFYIFYPAHLLIIWILNYIHII